MHTNLFRKLEKKVTWLAIREEVDHFSTEVDISASYWMLTTFDVGSGKMTPL
jgi:hypothetical protein